ncbi:PREDICTED: suppressor of cytokine signaling 2-like [Papilio xuthus]|uniref:Suppressor of cytokine signaling 2-like n=1 Tax=Papilio xuthus TaxID=66420 RepID=A0A194PEA7_PAPXU|nr:PREDICTED: suppressor of cytokine signaling 2-like [Papilio xuthus]KPI91686.1 Suppressor of cytokine signaling 6 [Papilio xuthus]
MNKNYERCTNCNRRKWLASGCLRKWLKPMECKHLQRSIDSKRDFNNTDIVNCVVLPDRKTSLNTNKFVKFWKNKFFMTGSVRSLQRYFSNKNNGGEYICSFNKTSDPSTSTDKRTVSNPCYDIKKDSSSDKITIKCQHSEGHSVLRGHHQHASMETCAIYCQLSKHGWYWGGITSSEAEELLAGQHDNVFLVRDSYDSRHILCVSFRCVGRTLHARLRHANGLFSLNNETFVPANRISEHCATVDVKSNLFEMPVKLARPLNRFARLDSLQMICRFVIRQTVNTNVWQKLPLPPNLITYVSLGSDYIVQT